MDKIHNSLPDFGRALPNGDRARWACLSAARSEPGRGWNGLYQSLPLPDHEVAIRQGCRTLRLDSVRRLAKRVLTILDGRLEEFFDLLPGGRS